MYPLRPLVFVAAGGLIAGAFDIVFACSYWLLKANVSPVRILQSVAAGVLGNASFRGGASTAALGLALHFGITLAMSAAYYFAARNWTLLAQRPWIYGALYGIVLYGVMTYVVLPLSAAAPSANDTLWIALSVAAHVLLVGIPIALCVRQATSI